jgi:hypothetical protein
MSTKHRFASWCIAPGALFLGILSLCLASCGHTEASAPIPVSTVMQVIHAYGRERKTAPSVPEKPIAAPPASPSDELYDSDGPYQAHIAAILLKEDFAQLEKTAKQVRASRARIKSGVWKLFAFYDGIVNPLDGTSFTDSDWDARFAVIKKWIAAYPDSATAQIALADTYVGYAWAARGSGYSDSVSQSGWNLFGQRIELAKSTLLQAAHLKEKCPFWYEAMQNVALAQGWDKQQARELLDEASAFEPTYYHFYREYANYLLPKWYGDEGNTQAFAEEISTRLGEPDGSIVYFEIASLLACQCDPDRNTLAGISWPKAKQGYISLKRLYGTSNLKMNRFALMSVMSGDKSSAREALAELGSDWNHLVWHSAESFESAKAWASAP